MWQMLTAPFRKVPSLCLPPSNIDVTEDSNQLSGEPMPTESSVLNELAGKQVRVYVNPRGISLTGKLVGHDSAAIVLEDAYGKTLVYKNQAISVTEDVAHV